MARLGQNLQPLQRTVALALVARLSSMKSSCKQLTVADQVPKIYTDGAFERVCKYDKTLSIDNCLPHHFADL